MWTLETGPGSNGSNSSLVKGKKYYHFPGLLYHTLIKYEERMSYSKTVATLTPILISQSSHISPLNYVIFMTIF